MPSVTAHHDRATFDSCRLGFDWSQRLQLEQAGVHNALNSTSLPADVAGGSSHARADCRAAALDHEPNLVFLWQSFADSALDHATLQWSTPTGVRAHLTGSSIGIVCTF
jgi:hypothetical protein